jgi:hypothetical protein
MTEKQQNALSSIMTILPDDSQKSIKEIAEYAISLGYMPTIKGKNKNYLDFTNSKLKKTILKIQTNPKFPYLEIKFYAMPTFSAFFQKAIDYRIKTWNRLKYEFSCFGCGKCNGTEGYTVTLPDGKNGFLCGFGLLPLPSLSTENVTEVKEAIRLQNEFFMK